MILWYIIVSFKNCIFFIFFYIRMLMDVNKFLLGENFVVKGYNLFFCMEDVDD